MTVPTEGWAWPAAENVECLLGIYLILLTRGIDSEGLVLRRLSAAVVPVRSFRRNKRAPRQGDRGAGLVEAPGVEPGSEDLQCNGSTCVADRFSFAATHAHRLA